MHTVWNSMTNISARNVLSPRYGKCWGNAVLNTTITIYYLKERWYLGLGFDLTLGVCQEFFLALPMAMGEAFSVCQIQFHIYKIQTLIISSALSFEVCRIFKAQDGLVHKRITMHSRCAQCDCTPAEGCLSVEQRRGVTSIGHFTSCPGIAKCLPGAILTIGATE